MLTTRRVLETLKEMGITHVVGLPDNSTAALFHELADDPDIYLITVTREGEAFATAAGLWMGGQNPLVLIQNTGLLESGDALRGTLTRMRIPVVVLVSYRGYKSLPEPTIATGVSGTLTPDDLSRRDVDSVATLLEPTLRAWNLPYELVADNNDLEKVMRAQTMAVEEQRPVGIVIAETIR
jgi:sulfopyruvate decarboxylase TPP-binding subunit